MARINKISILNKFIYAISYLFSLLLVLSFVARFINPSAFWIISFIGLAFPILVFINLFFTIYWFFISRKRVTFSIVSLIISIPLLLNYFNIISTSENSINSIKIMSFNCNSFDLYNFDNNKISRDKYYNFLQKENSDIICLQEFFTSTDTLLFNHKDSLIKLLNANIHFQITTSPRNTDYYGIATISKYPIINKGNIDFNFKTKNLCIFTDVLINNDTVRIYNAHLQSLNIVHVKTIYSNQPARIKKAKEKYSFQNKFKRFSQAFQNRAKQAKIIAKHIKNCKYKIILCGDFNDTPSSFTYNKLTKNLEDSFLEKGFGISTTYNGKVPFQRIDYIMHSKSLQCLDYEVKSFNSSDHFPIIGKYLLH